MRILHRLRTRTLLVATLCLVTPSHALQPQPVLKHGNCPASYNTSGSYCVPSANARFAVLKVGNCPSSYNTSGDYCVASSNDAKLAIPKHGSCPGGYNTNGDYCVSSK